MMRILLVDDAKCMRKILRNILERAGHTVVGEGDNGITGFSLYKELKPDLVLLDITMPKVNGINCIKMIKGYDSNAKIIICSAMGQRFIIIDALAAGAIDFVIKPFKESQILTAVNKIKE